MKTRTLLFLLTVCILPLASCSSDKYEYPPVFRELVDVKLNDDKIVESIVLNDNRVCFLEREDLKIDLPGVEIQDNTLRGLTHIEFLEENLVRLYGFAYVPILKPQKHIDHFDDGSILKLIRSWVSNDKYINIEIQVPKLDRVDRDFSVKEGVQVLSSPTHIVAATINSNSKGSLDLELMHRGDILCETGNKETLILSIDISQFKEESDSLSVTVRFKLRNGEVSSVKHDFK